MDNVDRDFLRKLYLSHQECTLCPSPSEVSEFYAQLLSSLFADFRQLSNFTEEQFINFMKELQQKLERLIRYDPGSGDSVSSASKFFSALPMLAEALQQDVTAMYEGDPAAKSRAEVIRTYPGFYAIAAYRVAHLLHMLGVNGIPRIITEHAHSKTGIDIHPAAKIGSHFCVDHGTGVVIGETSVLGNHVKIYQGVTLGALSVNKEDAERKRHPTIQDRVVIYAGATILGGETVIGHDSIVGGNVWLTKSVPPNSRIYYQSKMYNGDTNQTDLIVFKAEQ
jgi:serine O-acetyltransferase